MLAWYGDHLPSPAGPPGIDTRAGVPVRAHDGEPLGWLIGMDPTEPPDRLATELRTVELLASLLGAVLTSELECLELRRRVERAELDALTDPLTGVGNRRAWDQIFAAEELRCERYGSIASLISIDLDALKEINDALGHVVGDELLRRTAQVLVATKRRGDVVARLGGDESGILAIECDEHAVSILAHRIASAFPPLASSPRSIMRPTTLAPAWGAWQTPGPADAAMYGNVNVEWDLAHIS